MSWWDRVVRWVLGIVNGRRAPAAAAAQTRRTLNAADREWVIGIAAMLEGAPRTEAGVVVFTLSDELAQSMAARMREIAG